MKSEKLWVPCKTCEKQISVSAKSCPHCGARQKKFGALKWVGGAFFALIVIGGLTRMGEEARTPASAGASATSSKGSKAIAVAKEPEAVLPTPQREFLTVVGDYRERFRSAANELQQSALRDERRTALMKALGSRLTVENWIGTLRKLETNTEGKAIITVRLAPGVDLLTWNNALSDVLHETMIEKGTPLYTALMNMTVGETVMVSGDFIASTEDGAWETSMTIDGSMTAPEFLFQFNKISKQ